MLRVLLSSALMVIVGMSLRPSLAEPPTSRPSDDPAHGKKLLRAVRDGASSFDDPAVYWFLSAVDRHKQDETWLAEVPRCDATAEMLFRNPSEYRGKLVTIHGEIAERRDYRIENRLNGALLTQLEVAGENQNTIATILMNPADPNFRKGDRIQVHGFFIKTRRYESRAGTIAEGPLIVATSLAVMPANANAERTKDRMKSSTVMLAATAVLAVAWLMMKRRVNGNSGGRTRKVIPSTRETDSDFDWLRRLEAGQATESRRDSEP